MDISVVIPVYGCKAALPELYRRLTDTLQRITKDYEIILVNDACPQDSWSVIQDLCTSDQRVIGLEMSRNFGQIRAILAGLDYSTGDWVVVMDCDLQDKPEEILRLYQKAQEGYDVVFARRKIRKDSPLKVFVSNCFYKLYSFATDGKYDPALCNFSISSRQVIHQYCKMRELHRAFVIYIKWMGFRQGVIDVDHSERFEGKSSYNFKKRMCAAMEILTSQSDKLLRLTAMGGAVMSLISFIVVLTIVVRYFMYHIVPGWSSTIAAIFLMGGLIIMSIGIVGIYIGNIFMEVKHRPLYIVRTALNASDQNRGERQCAESQS